MLSSDTHHVSQGFVAASPTSAPASPDTHEHHLDDGKGKWSSVVTSATTKRRGAPSMQQIASATQELYKKAALVDDYAAIIRVPYAVKSKNELIAAYEKLRKFCRFENLKNSSRDDYESILRQAGEELVNPLVDFVWKRVASQNLRQVSVGALARDVSERLKDIETTSPGTAASLRQLKHLTTISKEAPALSPNPHNHSSVPALLDRLLMFLRQLKIIHEEMNTHSELSVATPASTKPTLDFFDFSDAHGQDDTLPEYYKRPLPIFQYPAQQPFSPVPGPSFVPRHYDSASRFTRNYSLFGERWPFSNNDMHDKMSGHGQKNLGAIGQPRNTNSLPNSPMFDSASSSRRSSDTSDQFNFETLRRISQIIDADPEELYANAHLLQAHKDGAGCACHCGSSNCLGGSSCINGRNINRELVPLEVQRRDLIAHLMALEASDAGETGQIEWVESPVRYKTALCKRVIDGEQCRYSKACGFAHCETEKDKFTRLHVATIRCTYGNKCHNPGCGRAHTPLEQRAAIRIYTAAIDRGRGTVPDS